jgi:hypothetical protein
MNNDISTGNVCPTIIKYDLLCTKYNGWIEADVRIGVKLRDLII